MTDRSGYSDDVYDHWAWIRWRGQVASAIRGKRGQKLLVDIRDALLAMPEKRLVSHALECEDGVCAMGAGARRRGLDLSTIDPEDSSRVAELLDVAEPLAREVAFMNDSACLRHETPEQRYSRMLWWVESEIRGGADE